MSSFTTPSGVILSVHPDYTPKAECDGCGSGWNKKLVPDTIYGLSIKEACCPHDHRYGVGGTQEDKDIADFELLENTLEIINNYTIAKQVGRLDKLKCAVYPHLLARHRAITYYDAVVRAGGSSFNFREVKDEVCDVVGISSDVPRLQLRKSKSRISRRKRCL